MKRPKKIEETANYSGNNGIKQQLIQSEHRVKAKEQVIGRLQDRLEQKRKGMNGDEAFKEIFKNFVVEARPSSAVDSKTLEVVKCTKRNVMGWFGN